MQKKSQMDPCFQFRHDMPAVALRVLIAVAVFVQSTWAQNAVDRVTDTTSAQQNTAIERVGVLGEPSSLTLEDAVELALRNSNDIEASRDDLRMSEYSCNASLGLHDVRLSPETYYRRTVTPVASALSGAANGSLVQTEGFSGVHVNGSTPVAGGSYQLDFSSIRSTTNSQFASLSPQYPSSLTLSYTQPLFRGLRIDDNRRQIQVARKNVMLSDADFQQRVMDILTDVTRAYWDLVFAVQNEQVQIEARNQARAQLESNRRQVDQGILAPIDVVAAESQIAVFEQDVFAAQETITRAENALKMLMLPDRRAPEWSRPLAPSTQPSLESPRVELLDAVNAALENRAELRRVQAQADINRINTRYFRDQTKPQIDLVGSYTSAGLAGTPRASTVSPFASGFEPLITRTNELSSLAGLSALPSFNFGSGGTVPDLFVGDLNRSFGNLFDSRFPTTQIGLKISLPLRNRTAEGNLGRSLAESDRIKNQNEQLEQQIEAEVRNALQAMRSAQARVTAAAAARNAAEQLFDSEQRRLQNGASTVFLVFQRQTDLITARGRELQAQTDLNKAIATFQRASGSTFQAHNVTVRGEHVASKSCAPPRP